MKQNRQSGAVSIFIVVFTALLVTVVTASFIQIMMRNQQQASNSDLSQSAYDSAMAGVEDAKRALIRLSKCERRGSGCDPATIRSQLNSGDCTSLEGTGIGVDFNDSGEVGVGDNTELNQAYTCVKVDMDTPYVEGQLTTDDGLDVIKLQGASDFDEIRLSWFNQSDLPEAGGAPIAQPWVTVGSLPTLSAWPQTQPPIMRTQSIQYEDGGLRLNDLDDDAKTLFLHPSEIDSDAPTSFEIDTRRSGGGNGVIPATCELNFHSGASYLCTKRIELTEVVNSDQEAYLQLAAFYNDAHYKVELLNNGTPVDFSNVQPIVDSTGRASDLFRRVRARISIQNPSIQFPDAALTVGKNLCKDFFVTDVAGDYNGDANNDGACEPSSSN